jgi:hypothetical protein
MKADSIAHIRASRTAGLRLPWKAWVIGAIAAIDALWILLTDFTFDVASAGKVAAIVLCLCVAAWFYRVRRRNFAFETLCVETAYLLAFSASAAVLSYLVTSLDLPLVDSRLIAVDAALGFDWAAYVGVFNDNAWLGVLSSVIYFTTLSQVALTLVALGLAGRLQTASRFVSAVILGALVCILVSAVLPAAGALGTLRPSAEFLASQPVVDLAYKQEFFDLRSGVQRYISLDGIHGLIAFPSYHCTLSVLIVLAFRAFGVWFWPVALLNAAIILSTPVDGGHHFIDALAGVAVGLLTWWIVAARKAEPALASDANAVPAARSST